jgi:subtilisin
MEDMGPVFHIPPVYDVMEVSGMLSEFVDGGIVRSKIPERWESTLGEGITAATLDTGVDSAHPDLKVKDAIDFTGGKNPMDRQRHGTHVLGLGNMQHNGMVGKGICPAAEMYGLKVLDDFGSGTEAAIVAAIRWCTKYKIDVINMSFGSTFKSEAVLAALYEYVEGGGIPVAAAGNDGRDKSNWPAAAPFVISVGAVDPYGRAARFSSWGDEVDIAAPGTDIVSAAPGGGAIKMSGTSMASPNVAWTLVLAKAYHKKIGEKAKTPLRNVTDALALLKASAQKHPDPDTKRFGFGLVDASAMLAFNDPVAEEPPPTRLSLSVPWMGIVIEQPAAGAETLTIRKA